MNPRVLIAEDLDEQRKLYRALLKSAPYRIDFAQDGEVAVSMTRKACEADDPYQLILLDGAMPNLSGLGAAEQLIALDPDCDTSIYFLTNLEKDDPTLNLRIRLMNLDPQIHILAKNDCIVRLQSVIEELLARSKDEARGQAGN